MNKGIKFRAWNLLAKKWLNPSEILVDGSGELYYTVNSKLFRFQRDIIIEQSTNLLDKNGVEIYEGDIVKLSFKPGLFVVNWEQSQMRYSLWNKLKADPNCLYFPNNWAFVTENNYEVIGNIHENPKLLETNS